MTRFILFIGILIGIAYVLTDPPEAKTALSANEIPVHNDKPLLTSWGPTLGSLRNGVGVRTRGGATTMLASNQSTEPYGAETGASEAATLAANAQTSAPAEDQTGAKRHEPPITVASLQEPAQQKQPVAAEPVVDRVAAALPPERRGLFGRPLAPKHVQAVRDTRQAEAAPRNRGLFKRLLGRSKQPARAWGLGPAR